MPTRSAARFVMAYVTAPDRKTAETIARAVLEARLAACANLASVDSLYWWRGSLERTKEILVIFKTRRACVPKVMAAVKAAHPYEVPCIVTYRMDDGHPRYLAWIDEETRPQR